MRRREERRGLIGHSFRSAARASAGLPGCDSPPAPFAPDPPLVAGPSLAAGPPLVARPSLAVDPPFVARPSFAVDPPPVARPSFAVRPPPVARPSVAAGMQVTAGQPSSSDGGRP